MCELPATNGASIPATLRVLPFGAGAEGLRKAKNKKLDPANVVAAIAGVLLIIYYALR